MPEDTPTRHEPNREELNPEEPNSPDPSAASPPDPTTEAPTEPPPIPCDGFFDTVLTPVANPTDARETACAVRTYLPSEATVYVAHVVQTGEGVPDKAGVEQRRAFAERAYEAFDAELHGPTSSARNAPATLPSATPVTLYGRNVPRTILAGARDVGATAVVFTPRGGGRWAKLLTGSVSENLLRESEVPVLALPRRRERLVLD